MAHENLARRRLARTRLALRARVEPPDPQRPPGARCAPASSPPTTPSTSRVEDGVVTAVGPGAERPAGAEVVDAGGRWLIPGLWDQHTHLTQWTLASQRLDLGGTRSPEEIVRAVAERIRGTPGPAGRRLGPPHRHVGPRGHGHRARRGLRRHPGRADQRRRPPRLAEHDRADAPRDAGARLGRARDRVVRGVPAPGHARRRRRHLAGGLPADARRRGRPGHRRAWSTSSSARAWRAGPSGGPRAATCCGSAGRRTPTPSTTCSPPACAPATRWPATRG